MTDALSDASYFACGKTSGLRLLGTTGLGLRPSLACSGGFAKDASDLGQQLSAKANALNRLTSRGKKLPKIEKQLKEEIKGLIKNLQDLGCTIEALDDGAYFVSPSRTNITLVPSEVEDSDSSPRPI